MKKLVTICLAVMIVMGSVCSSMAGVVEFTDEVSFKNATGDPQYFIDFESYGDGTPVVGAPTVEGDEWLNLGIQFAATELGDGLMLYEGENVSPTHALIDSAGSDITSYLITFSTPVVSFGVYIVDSEITSINEKIILKDDNGNILGEFAMPVHPDGTSGSYISKEFRGYISDIPIAEVHIIEDLDSEGLLLDNVMYSVPVSGPVAYWSFDDPCNPGHDDSGNGNDVTLYGPKTVDGACDGALNFDGQDDYVYIAGNSGLLGGMQFDDLAVSSWFKFSGVPETPTHNWSPIIANETTDGEFTIAVWYNNDPDYGRVMAHVYLTNPNRGLYLWGPYVDDGEFHHVCLNKNSSEVVLVVDGVEYDSTASTGPLWHTGTWHFAIGVKYTVIPYPDQIFKGIIDEVRIYDRALSACEIAELAAECEMPCGSQVIYSTNFENVFDPLKKWSNTSTTLTPGTAEHPVDRFLGQLGNETLNLNLGCLPQHDQIILSFDLYIIDTWDGSRTGSGGDTCGGWSTLGPDIWELSIDSGDTLLYTTFSNSNRPYGQAYPAWYPDENHPARTGAEENNTLGYGWDSVYKLTFSFPHTANSLTLNFSGSGLQCLDDESWGIDNVKVEVPCEPEPVSVDVDIKPTSCPNPLSVESKGMLPVAILGSEDFDVTDIDIAPTRLAGVAPKRSWLEDVAGPVPPTDANECACTTTGPDGYTDLTLKFKTREIVAALVGAEVDLTSGEELTLALTGALNDEMEIEGADCMVVVGQVPRSIHAKRSDVNGDGVVSMLDVVIVAENWLESSVEQD
jgi:hypothetical protein